MARFHAIAHTNAQQVDHPSRSAWDFQPLPLVAQATICLYDLAYWGFLSADLSIHLCHDDPMGPRQSGMLSHGRDLLFEAILRPRLRQLYRVSESLLSNHGSCGGWLAEAAGIKLLICAKILIQCLFRHHLALVSLVSRLH